VGRRQEEGGRRREEREGRREERREEEGGRREKRRGREEGEEGVRKEKGALGKFKNRGGRTYDGQAIIAKLSLHSIRESSDRSRQRHNRIVLD
jgi:hypothetical protein